MKKNRLFIRTAILILLFSALGYTLYANVFRSNEVVKVGQEAPDFVLKDLNGNAVKLSDYRGKGVFLNFWGTWCPPCKKEMPYMEKYYKQLKDEGVEIIAVDIAEPELRVKNFVKEHKLTFPVVIDDGEVKDAYNIVPLPTTFLIDKNGIVIDEIKEGMDEQAILENMARIKP